MLSLHIGPISAEAGVPRATVRARQFKIAHDLREMQVRGQIDEADVGKLKVGQRESLGPLLRQRYQLP